MSLGFSKAPSDGTYDQSALERPGALLVSLHFIRTALRRRLGACILFAALGLLVAGTFLYAFPPPHAAKASLVLTSESQLDPTRATATNVSLLKTQTLATRTIANLGITMTPEDFLDTLVIEPVGLELLSLTLTAPSDAEAVRRLDALTSTYLDFRAEQLSFQSRVLVDGLKERIGELQTEVEGLSRQIEQLSRTAGANAGKLSDLIAQRGSIQSRIETLEESVEDATLRNSAVVSSSRVLDPPAAEPGRAARSVILGLASGLIGGIALGCGWVLFHALTSNRLRRRADIAGVLEIAVPVSVGRIAPLPAPWRGMPPLQALDRRRADDRQRLAHAIEEELLLPGRGSRLAVVAVDSTDEVSFAVADAGRNLAARGCSITILDLTRHGGRQLRAALRTSGAPDNPTVLRPAGVPALAHRPADLLAVGVWDDGEDTPSPHLGDVTLTLADLDPAVGAAHLSAWTDRVILVLSAGRSSVEKVRTVADEVRAAGLELRFAALLRTERADESSGTLNVEEPAFPKHSDEDVGADTPGWVEVR